MTGKVADRYPMVRGWLRTKILEILLAHPEGIRPSALRAMMSYRSSEKCIRVTVSNLRQLGVPIVTVRQGAYRWYMLGDG